MHMLDFCISQVLWTPEYLSENFRYIQPLVPLSELHQQRECNLEYHRDIHGKSIRAIRGNMVSANYRSCLEYNNTLIFKKTETYLNTIFFLHVENLFKYKIITRGVFSNKNLFSFSNISFPLKN